MRLAGIVICLMCGSVAGCGVKLPGSDEALQAGVAAPANAPAAVQGGGAVSTAQTERTAAKSPGPASAPAASASVATAITSGRAKPPQITNFRSQTIILYYSQGGHDGEKVNASSLPLPLRLRTADASTPRLEVMTVQGLRWIARTDVVVE